MTLLAFRPTSDPSVDGAVARLAEEFGHRLPTSVVRRVVWDCRQDLSGSPAGALPELVERLARHRLDPRQP